ncbi:TAP-like protein [Nonomuraea solani]|uniref:TAP-like protein n=1 Tax=Nonomuraea solani TaxID=1144553 RepID=A0A1H6EJG3_9ACTN|nr:alpha/beta hydrolase [Nonomuraea solani]SEG97453.1 TAP-like protein [Nonomuraea solani]
MRRAIHLAAGPAIVAYVYGGRPRSPGASNPQHRLNVSGTPVAWNNAVAGQQPRTTVLEYTGVGHGQYHNSVCARTHIETYLTSLVPPPARTALPSIPRSRRR